MSGTGLLLSLWMLAAGGRAATPCPPERLSHARKAYAPLPYLRDLSATCGAVGVPILRIEIDGQGRVRGHRFLRGSGCKAADERLRQCLRVWRYEPATCEGKPVADALTLTINWHPEERPGEVRCPPEPRDPGSKTQ
jgi:TonB family protein